jgi:hypothetical protein
MLLVLIVFSANALKAEQATAPANSAVPRDAVVSVALGQSVDALAGPWKFHIGDDPHWSDPDFDDSDWEQYDLAPGAARLDPAQVLQMPELPGWQQHGHSQYAGYAWYRIRLNLEPASTSRALLMPLHVQDGYQVFLNGHWIVGFGKLYGFHRTYNEQTLLFPIPPEVSTRGGPATLAISADNLPEALRRRHSSSARKTTSQCSQWCARPQRRR